MMLMMMMMLMKKKKKEKKKRNKKKKETDLALHFFWPGAGEEPGLSGRRWPPAIHDRPSHVLSIEPAIVERSFDVSC